MSFNPYKVFKSLIPTYPRQIGVVISGGSGAFTIELAGGGTLNALGVASIGDQVYVRDGVIEGVAPTLPIELIEV